MSNKLSAGFNEIIIDEFLMGKHSEKDLAQYAVDNLPDDQRGEISDGYHTFNELYDHRITLYIALLRQLSKTSEVDLIWKSEVHSDGTVWDNWFILGFGTIPGHQITYHLPISRWGECSFAKVIDKAPKFDGHTPADVLERLKLL